MPRRPKQYVLREPGELEAIVSPVRHHLIRTLSMLGPVSVKELAAAMGRSAESLYYHLRELEAVGLVIESGERVVRGRPEMLYATVGGKLVTDPEQSSPEYLEAYRRSASALLRLADRQMSAAIETQAEQGKRRDVSLRTQQVQARLSPAAQKELARRLDEILVFVGENDDPEREERVVLTLFSAPLG